MSAPRYGPLCKFKDRGRGRRDGRDCVPSLLAVQTLAETGEAISAPYPDVLLSRALHEITGVHQRFERQVDGDRAALAKLRKDWELAGEALVRTAQLVVEAHAPLTEEELRPHGYDELGEGNGHKARSRSDRRRDLYDLQPSRPVVSIAAHVKPPWLSSDLVVPNYGRSRLPV